MKKERRISVRELHKDLPKIACAVKKGSSYIVVKHNTPLFRLTPLLEDHVQPLYKKEDFSALMFDHTDPQLSSLMDDIIYPSQSHDPS